MAETKLIDFNEIKTCYLVIGGKKAKKKIEDDLQANPILLYGKEMKRGRCEKYLGSQVSCKGLAKSIEETIVKRRCQVLRSIYEIKAVIEDNRSSLFGGIVTALTIWE